MGLTQEVLAKQCNLSRSLVAAIERGTETTDETKKKILQVVPSEIKDKFFQEMPSSNNISIHDNEDMITNLFGIRRAKHIDISGSWNAVWLTTVNDKENRNREIIHVSRRWNGSWQFMNECVSEDNPEGGYLWISRLDLFDNRHLLGYYVARDSAVIAKGTLCLELQPNGRQIIGTWEGLNFDTMWANGMVAMCSANSDIQTDPNDLLNKFIKKRPSMPYQTGGYHGNKS